MKMFASCTVYPVPTVKFACCVVSVLEQSKFCSMAKMASGPERIAGFEFATLAGAGTPCQLIMCEIMMRGEGGCDAHDGEVADLRLLAVPDDVVLAVGHCISQKRRVRQRHPLVINHANASTHPTTGSAHRAQAI